MMTKSEQDRALRDSVISRFAVLAIAPDQERKFAVGTESARRLGYDGAELDALPASVVDSFCGVGNPLLMGEPELGQTVLDLGCGAGLDTLLAARCVGRSGRGLGVDMTPEMIAKARRNAQSLGQANVEFILGAIEALPLADSSVDRIMSNGVFNLCLRKPNALSETFRVLKPGGRLQMADIVLEPHVTPEEAARKGAWSD